MDYSLNKSEHWKSYALFFKNTMAARKMTETQLAEKAHIDEEALLQFLKMKRSLDFEKILTLTDALGLEIYFEPREKNMSLRKLFDKGREELSKREKKSQGK